MTDSNPRSYVHAEVLGGVQLRYGGWRPDLTPGAPLERP